MQVLAHSPAEREKWNNLTQSGREDLLDHLEQALAYHVATDRRKERTYQVDVNDLMFITRLIPITDQQFVFIDAESTSAVHHWTFKHSWWWANQPHAKQQEKEADLREFNDALQAALEANHEHRVQIAGAVVDGCVYAVPKGVRPGRFAEVAFGICNLVKGGGYNFVSMSCTTTLSRAPAQ